MLTSNKIKALENEIKALKAVQPLNGGALTKHSTTATWEGAIDKNSPISQYSMLAAFEITFYRNDGIVKTPFVQFAYNLSPDMNSYSHSRSSGAIIGAANDTITYKIVLYYNWWPFPDSQTTGNLKLTVNAYSTVEGYVEIKRVYS